MKMKATLFAVVIISAVVLSGSAVAPATAAATPVISQAVLDSATIAGFGLSTTLSENCQPWNDQGNGCYQRVCVDGNGHMYCEEMCKGGTSHRIHC